MLISFGSALQATKYTLLLGHKHDPDTALAFLEDWMHGDFSRWREEFGAFIEENPDPDLTMEQAAGLLLDLVNKRDPRVWNAYSAVARSWRTAYRPGYYFRKVLSRLVG